MENDEYDDDEDTPPQDDTPTPAADETRPQQKVKTASTTGGSGRHPGRQSRGSGGDDGGRGSTEGTGRQRTRGTLKRNIRRPSTGPWKWKKDLCELLKRMGGLEKVCRVQLIPPRVGGPTVHPKPLGRKIADSIPVTHPTLFRVFTEKDMIFSNENVKGGE